jgi:hypothetical protein
MLRGVLKDDADFKFPSNAHLGVGKRTRCRARQVCKLVFFVNWFYLEWRFVDTAHASPYSTDGKADVHRGQVLLL